jgi:hypothetical protein
LRIDGRAGGIVLVDGAQGVRLGREHEVR